ncbi:uncharacterized protein LOC132564677 [Ylistrum balloti]|uniref:uncharacterized protein LOC132564677 n=1 Tax=Ylistrum balloti TaxID=509963 RepID=UPI002905D8B7|nr:uncharacterized protein LOC132564677 [Ylistrum balloti]
MPIKEGDRTKWIMFETGPYSCYPILETSLKEKGIAIEDITKVFVTHIHLDHSGGAWKLAESGTDIYVHPIGAPFMVDPTKLVESASRIYGDQMETLWSMVKGIDKKKVFPVDDGKVYYFKDLEGNEFSVQAHHNPGHASHHIAWQAGKILFAGDVLGIRIDNCLVDVPCPPPDYHPELWLDSITKIQKLDLDEVVLTHFGSFTDIDHHIDQLKNRMRKVMDWFRRQLKQSITRNEVEKQFIDFIKQGYIQNGMTEKDIENYININPPFMTVMGVLRYLKKYEELTCSDI